MVEQSLYQKIKENRRKLDACPRHYMDIGPPPYAMGQRCTCKRCGGILSLIEAAQYARGYMAAGRNPDEVIPGFYGSDFSSDNEKVCCPKCKGQNGIQVTKDDWFDCDFCDATGTVTRLEALLYINTLLHPGA